MCTTRCRAVVCNPAANSFSGPDTQDAWVPIYSQATFILFVVAVMRPTNVANQLAVGAEGEMGRGRIL